MDSCELIRSQFELQSDYAAGVALDYMAEVSEQLQAPGEQNERFFRLLLAALDYLREERANGLWPVVTYFTPVGSPVVGFPAGLASKSGLQEHCGRYAEAASRAVDT